MALTKQFDFRVSGRGVLVDPTLPATPANMTFTVETVTVNGTQHPADSLDSTSLAEVNTAVETIVQKHYRTQQTVSFTAADVEAGQTVIFTCGDLVVTYVHSGADITTAAGLATAMKAACDGNPNWAQRFNVTIGVGVLTIVQKGNHTKAPAIVVSGTGTFTATVAA